MSKFFRFIIRFPKLTIVACLLLLVAFSIGISRVYLDNDILHWFSPKSPIASLNYYVNDVFESGNPLILMLRAPSPVLERDNLIHIRRLSRLSEEVAGIASVYSLTEAEDIRGQDDEMIVERLFPEDISTMADFEDTVAYVRSKESYRSLLSQDGLSTAIILQIEPDAPADQVAEAVRTKVDNYIKAEVPTWRVYHGGAPNMLNSISEMVVRDIGFLVPLVSLVVLIVLFLSFRSIKGILLPLISVLFSTASAMGIMGYLGMPLTTFGVLIPVVLIAVGNAYGIHIINEYYERRLALEAGEALYETLRRTFVPVLMSALTTVGGFVSIAVANDMLAARNFGIISAIGVVFSLLFTLTWIPAWIRLLPKGKQNIGHLNEKTEHGVFLAVAQFVFRRKIPILISFLALAIVAVYFISKVEVKVDYLAYFDEEAEVSRVTRQINTTFDGSFEMKLYVKGDAIDPLTLRSIQIIEEQLRFKSGGNPRPTSLVNVISSLNNGIVQVPGIPETSQEIGNLFFFIEGNEMIRPLVTDGKDELLVSFLLPSFASSERYAIIQEAENLLKAYQNITVKSRIDAREQVEHLATIMLYNRLVRAGWPQPREAIADFVRRTFTNAELSTYEEQALYLEQAASAFSQTLTSGALSAYDIKYALSPLVWQSVPIPHGETPLFEKQGVTGLMKIFTDIEQTLLRNQMISLLLIIVIVVILNALTFHSFLEGALSLIPMVFTLLVNFAVMGMFRIPMDFITVTIAAIAVGAGIDYTIHFLSRYTHEIRLGKDYEKAFYHAFVTTGKGIIFNSLSVGLGFAVLLFSTIVPMRNFGLLMFITMIISALSALTLLPVCIMLLRKTLKLNSVGGP